MKLSSRLLSCASLVRPGGVTADVGTDHGYLAIYLLEQGICPRVFASDLREGPLSAARRSAAKAGLSDQITFVLSDGLRSLPATEIDTVICAGMGGDNIISILDAEPAVRSPEKQLILQPQSKVADLRRWLAEQGFTIRRERLSRDGKFVYTAMDAAYTGATETLSPGRQLMPEILLQSGDPLLRDYFVRVRDSVTMSVEGLRRAKEPDRALQIYYETALSELMEMEARYDLGQ